MKRTFAMLMLLLMVAVAAYSQVQPTGPPATGGVQANKSAMVGGRHDFGPGGFFARFNAKEAAGTAPIGVCDYCHRPHIMSDGIAAPLWARASANQATGKYGYYSSISLDADSANGHLRPINLDNNYSAFCLSCHDGSAFLASSAYGSNGTPYSSAGYPYTTSDVVPDSFKFADAGYGPSGELQLSHTHPVNIDYDYAVANDGEIYGRQAAGYVWLDNGTTPPTAIGRLFPGPNGPTMQCSSCHNPHKVTKGIGVVSPSTDNGGALCVTCHKK
jgi:predicted CXXCH cytochrome family protein